MKVLIIGGGGREHAIALAVNQSKHLTKLYCAPGNGGTGMIGENVNIGAMEFLRLADFAEKEKIDLTIVGMDDPLVGGIVDVFEERGLRIFGPDKKAAIIEGSKSFAKDLMRKYQIPTAGYDVFEDSQSALKHLEKCSYPVVVKADGLALGKGVLICEDQKTAVDGVKEFMMEHKFGDAGNKIVIEEFMEGREVSVLSFVDGEHIQLLSSAQDHKRACDHDKGLNTGGMGTFSPSPFYTDEVDDFCKKHIYQATVDAMKSEGRMFKGVLFFGLMLTKEGPKVLEYNARFGDPEAQVILPRMKTDILDVMNACLDGTLNEIEIEFEDNAAVCVVLASNGYPLEYEKNKLIQGLSHFENRSDLFCFHAGTIQRDGQIYSNGGRVLGVTALGEDLKKARANAYEAVELVQFENKYYRTDIGKAIEKTQS